MAGFLNMAAEKAEYLNDHGLFSVALLVFVLMFCAHGIEEPIKCRIRQAAGELVSPENWARAFHIIRGRAIRGSHRMRRRATRLMNACDYAAARLYLNMVDREARHLARIEEERQERRRRIYRRVRRKMLADPSAEFAERHLITLQK